MANGTGKSIAAKRDGMLKELHDLRDKLSQLYQKNVKLDEENASLKKEVREMKKEIAGVIDMMRALREELKKAHEMFFKSRKAPAVQQVSTSSS